MSTEQHLTEAFDALQKARAEGIEDKHSDESVGNAIQEIIVARERLDMIESETTEETDR